MPTKLSRILLIVEAFVFGLPASVLILAYTNFFIHENSDYLRFSHQVDTIAVLLILYLLAIGSGWRLFIAYLRGGAANLYRLHWIWWAAVILGAIILLASLLSIILPVLPESRGWLFQYNFQPFAVTFPWNILLIHLTIERFWRKPPHITSAQINISEL